MREMLAKCCAVIAVLSMTWSCGGTIEAEGDADMDPIPDPTPDIGMDTVPDPSSEPPADTVPDPTTDPIPDPTTEVPGDPGTDTSSDTPPEIIPSDGSVGAACGDDGECTGVPGDGAFCLDSVGGWFTFPGGYCSADCGSDADCGPGATCVNVWVAQLCFRDCTTYDECRVEEGYVCEPIPMVTSEPYCVPMPY